MGQQVSDANSFWVQTLHLWHLPLWQTLIQLRCVYTPRIKARSTPRMLDAPMSPCTFVCYEVTEFFPTWTLPNPS
ncbi:hypothetical protein JR316_0007299 [Psilocybe cubensis]|uniref:Uncharacterized protein n=1 Tax=Psilocybe cubensis TaxID=181762 RepID=A0ACB8GYN7_PSICU|nr:hypothetical protein JR316_0007299 [Psilocybe cubensis]KAH9480699.1 hypothetical protein JR316_0007299 [Psilocybe cubensis]